MVSCKIVCGDALAELRKLPDESVQCCVTSPPYFSLRDYGVAGQIGLEDTPTAYVARLVEVFREVRRALADDGTLWLNIGDSYAGSWGAQGHRESSTNGQIISRNQIANHPKRARNTGSIKEDGLKPKDLIGVPWRLAFALQADGWYLRSDIIWAKPNCMPESVRDRPTRSHEYLFLLSKRATYFYDADAIAEPCTESTEARLAQNVEAQAGSSRANGGAKTNGTMKAVGSRSLRRNETDLMGAEIINPPPHNSIESRKARASVATKYHPTTERNGIRRASDAMERGEQGSGMRNKRDVWTVAPANYAEAHFATFPPALITPCILAGTRPGDTVLDPFGGSGTTGQVAIELGRNAILIELNPTYVELIRQRTTTTPGLPFQPSTP